MHPTDQLTWRHAARRTLGRRQGLFEQRVRRPAQRRRRRLHMRLLLRAGHACTTCAACCCCCQCCMAPGGAAAGSQPWLLLRRPWPLGGSDSAGAGGTLATRGRPSLRAVQRRMHTVVWKACLGRALATQRFFKHACRWPVPARQSRRHQRRQQKILLGPSARACGKRGRFMSKKPSSADRGQRVKGSTFQQRQQRKLFLCAFCIEGGQSWNADCSKVLKLSPEKRCDAMLGLAITSPGCPPPTSWVPLRKAGLSRIPSPALHRGGSWIRS